HHARCDPRSEVMWALEVLGPDVGGEPVLGVVRQGEGFFIVFERGDGHDGAEDFLLEDPRVRRDVGKDGGCDVVPGGEALGAAAAGEEAAFCFADLDVAHDLFAVGRVNEGTDFRGWVAGEAYDDVLRAFGKAGDEDVVDVPVYKHPGTCGAAFAVEGEDAEDGGIEGCFDGGIGENDGRALPDQFQGETLELRCRRGGDGGAGGAVTGKGNDRDVRVLDQVVAGNAAGSEDQVEDAIGQACLAEDFWPQHGRERSVAGWLHDHGVAGGDGGGQLPGLLH